MTKIVDIKTGKERVESRSLLVDHASGQITANPPLTPEEERMLRIRGSLERVNALMAELRKLKEHSDEI